MLPFFIVLGVNLGVPIALQGALGAVIMLATVIAKPLLSLLADAFPDWRKIIFVGTVMLSGLSFGSIIFIPGFGVQPNFSGVLVVPRDLSPNVSASLPDQIVANSSMEGPGSPDNFSLNNLSHSFVLVPSNGEFTGVK